ncbi:MAG: hypothetical protein ABDH20_09920 [Thermus sp.]
MTAEAAYQSLLWFQRETAYLASLGALAAWDQRTMIPKKGHAHRAKQVAALAKLLHGRMTNPRIGEWLERVEGSHLVQDPLSNAAVNVREWRQAYERARAIPERLEAGRGGERKQELWEEARPKDNWQGFLPYLKRVFSCSPGRRRRSSTPSGARGTLRMGSPPMPLWTDTSQGMRAAELLPLCPAAPGPSRAFGPHPGEPK